MKRLSIGLAALIAASLSVSAQEVTALIPARTGDAIQVATTVKSGANTLRVSLQYETGVTPPDQLVLILESPAGINFKDGNGVTLFFDQQPAIPIKAVCQAPFPHKDGVTEVAVYHIPEAEFKKLSAAKNWIIKIEGPNRAITAFHVMSANVLFKNYIEHSLGMRAAGRR